jgi:putative chitinase
LTQDQKGSDTIKYFADYVAGKIPRAALRSFVKQAQLQRKEKRGKTSGEKMWWNVSNPGNSYASVEVVASSKEEAIEKALGDDGYPSWANTRQSIVAEPVRPYEEKSGSGTHELYNKQTGEAVPDTEFSPRNTADQLTRLQDYVNHGQHGMSAQDAAAVFSVRSTDSDDTASAFTSPPAPPGRPNDPNGRYAIVPRSDPALYGSSTGGTPDYQFRFNMGNPAEQAQGRYVLQAWAARNNVVAADYMVVDTEQWDRPADADQTDVNPLRPTGPGPWELASRSNNQVYFNPQQTNRAAAETEARLWLSLTGYNPSDFVVRTREGSRSDAEQSGIIDIEPDIEVIYPGSTTDLAQQRATPGTFSGAWKVLVNGEEVYRFSGVGNNQSDANRVAAQWLRNNGRGVSGEGFEVYPIMTEGVAELEEDWKSALATGAMAGAMAMGASAKVPEIVRQAVEPGDTVYSIARQNNVNPIEIFKLNKMDRNTKLEIGQKVLVPDYSKPAAAKSTVKPLPTKVAQPATSKVSPAQDSEVTLLSMNSDAEAALQTAAKAAGLRGVELAQFMAQTRHESWDFSKMKEVGSKQRFAKYEKPKLAKQLGNKVKGDGELFKGRGFIQLTGRDNYTRASKQIFGDDRLVKNPELASKLDVGAQIALWFWKNQVRPNVKNFNNTIEVVKAINAGEPTHVVQQRHNKFKEYMAVL